LALKLFFRHRHDVTAGSRHSLDPRISFFTAVSMLSLLTNQIIRPPAELIEALLREVAVVLLAVRPATESSINPAIHSRLLVARLTAQTQLNN